MLFPVRRLLELKEHAGVVAVPRTATLERALKLMIEHDFSLLPVLDDDGALMGTVSEQSISRSFYHLRQREIDLSLTVDNCLSTPVVYDADADLHDVLNRLQEVRAVIVVEDDQPVGIITTYDTTTYFRNLARDFVLLRDIELTLRAFIRRAFPDDERMTQALLAGVGAERGEPDQPRRPLDRLSFTEHYNLILAQENWPAFEGALEPRSVFTSLMEQVRDIRNEIFHFRGSPTPAEVDLLQYAHEWIMTRASLHGVTAPPNGEEPAA